MPPKPRKYQPKCSDCLFSDQCELKRSCGHFAPYDDTYSADIENQIDKERTAFYRAWEEYIADYE